jgi:DNA-directed RNA polymerase
LKVSETERSSIDEKEVDLSDETADQELEPRESEVGGKTEADILLMGKFVELCDLLPPLPQKGDFKVETIKGSQYFFS